MSCALAGEPPGIGEQQVNIVRIMKDLKLVPDVGKDNPLCKSFLEDFRKQTHIEYIKPIILTDNYDDPMLKVYRDKCPKLVLNKHTGFARVDPNEVEKSLREQGVPEDKLDEELDKYASEITYGTRNFKLYKVELDNNQKNGDEYVFYDQDERMAIPERYAGEIPQPGAGVYKLVDFKNCSIRGGVAIGSLYRVARAMKDKPQVPSYHGLITYKQNNYIFNFESIKARNGGLALHTYNQQQERLRPLCSYRTY